jgi:hypothetical protein
MRYAVGGLLWSTAASLFAVVMSLRYEPALASFLPSPLVWVVLACSWLAFFTPVLLIIGPAVVGGRRSAGP